MEGFLTKGVVRAEPVIVEKQRVSVDGDAGVLVCCDKVVASCDTVGVEPRTSAVSKVARIPRQKEPLFGLKVA